jgi:hypothetical protein
MPGEELTIVFRHGRLRVDPALQAINTIFNNHNVEAGFELYGETMSLTEVLDLLKRTRRRVFNLIGQRFQIRLASARNFQLDLLNIKSLVDLTFSWDEFACEFVGNSNFVMGWVADSDYEYWQNAQDPLQYTAAGRSYADLRVISNNLPPPLTQKIIDISANPGRRILRHGYIEVVGAVMWLGERFWFLTGANRKSVVQSEWLQSSECPGRTIRLQAADECFKTDKGAAGELQVRLRCLLFRKFGSRYTVSLQE